jgi:Protein of unknown function (DUF1572)
MALQLTTSFLEDSIGLLRFYKQLADRAIAQVTDEQLFTNLDPEANSIAIIVKHMAGNMRSVGLTSSPATERSQPATVIANL